MKVRVAAAALGPYRRSGPPGNQTDQPQIGSSAATRRKADGSERKKGRSAPLPTVIKLRLIHIEVQCQQTFTV